MEKLLGQNIKDLEARRQFMIDNADECEDKTFTKQLTAEELATLRVDHSENAVNSARSFIDRNPDMYGATIVAVDLYDNIEDYLEDANEG